MSAYTQYRTIKPRGAMSDLSDVRSILTKLKKHRMINVEQEVTRVDAFAEAMAEQPELIDNFLQSNDADPLIQEATKHRDRKIIEVLATLPVRSFVQPLFSLDTSNVTPILDENEQALVYRAASLPRNKRTAACLASDDALDGPVEPPRKRQRHLDTEPEYLPPADELQVVQLAQMRTPPPELQEAAKRVKWLRICENSSKLDLTCKECQRNYTTYKCDYRFVFYSDTTIYTNGGTGYPDSAQVERAVCADCSKARRAEKSVTSTQNNNTNTNTVTDENEIIVNENNTNNSVMVC